ncbi:MAG TPA: organomercurial lyase [Candidatus Binatia bacterium]|nr:organomercurial lyase [Candidatus Binatia bacterium]
MEFDVRVKMAVYGLFAETGRRPAPEEVASRAGLDSAQVLAAYKDLRAQRLLLLEPDGRTIRMAPPFSGVPTQHRVEVDGIEYFANCAWDALGIPAALRMPGRVRSRCEESGAPLVLEVGRQGPEASAWLFHCLVPAARWWDDLVFT